jgi:hypothetical protein
MGEYLESGLICLDCIGTGEPSEQAETLKMQVLEIFPHRTLLIACLLPHRLLTRERLPD